MHQTGQNVTAIAVTAQRMLRGHGGQLVVGDLDNTSLITGDNVRKNDDQNNADQQKQTDHCAPILFQSAKDLFGLTGTLEVDILAIEHIAGRTSISFSHRDHPPLLYLARIRGSMNA